jgi:hypothetical protein
MLYLINVNTLQTFPDSYVANCAMVRLALLR